MVFDNDRCFEGAFVRNLDGIFPRHRYRIDELGCLGLASKCRMISPDIVLTFGFGCAEELRGLTDLKTVTQHGPLCLLAEMGSDGGMI